MVDIVFEKVFYCSDMTRHLNYVLFTYMCWVTMYKSSQIHSRRHSNYQFRDQSRYCNMKYLPFILFPLLGTLKSSSLVSKLHISEHGFDYDEDVEYDPETKAITLTVPAHNNVSAQVLILHAETVNWRK